MNHPADKKSRGNADGLSFSGLIRRFANGDGVGPIDLCIAQGSTTVLLGASGSGKSTLLRTVVGLEQASAGEIRVSGEKLTSANLAQTRRRVGYVIQEGGLFPHLCAADNVTLAARAQQMDPAQIEARMQWLCSLVDLSPEQLDHFPAELSGGQRQRVALIRALMLEPDLLLLDEPLAALDPLLRHRLRQELKALFRKLGKTVLLVTHDLIEAAFLADQLVLLRDGVIEQVGSPAQLLRNPATLYAQQFVNAQSLDPDALPGDPS